LHLPGFLLSDIREALRTCSLEQYRAYGFVRARRVSQQILDITQLLLQAGAGQIISVTTQFTFTSFQDFLAMVSRLVSREYSFDDTLCDLTDGPGFQRPDLSGRDVLFAWGVESGLRDYLQPLVTTCDLFIEAGANVPGDEHSTRAFNFLGGQQSQG
jgi:hypothetical protein